MKYFLISDNVDTQTGMRLAGIEGVVVHEKEEFLSAFSSATADRQCAVLLITEKAADLCPEKVDEHKLSGALPLIVELPDRHGTSRGEDSILKYVKEAVGMSPQ